MTAQTEPIERTGPVATVAGIIRAHGRIGRPGAARCVSPYPRSRSANARSTRPPERVGCLGSMASPIGRRASRIVVLP